MADLLASLLSFPPEKQVSAQEFDKQANIYVKLLQNTASSSWTKSLDKRSLLELLDPGVNSLPYLYCLLEHTKAVGKDTHRLETLLNQILVFLTVFDPVQIRYAGTQFRDLYSWTVEAFGDYDTTDLTPLSAAILRLDPSAGTFTTNHLMFLRLCFIKGLPSQALPIIDKNIYAFPHALPHSLPAEIAGDEHELSNAYITIKSGFTHKLTAETILEYYLLAANVYIGQRKWQRARLFLECLLLHPSAQHATSALQVEAYKKWLLVGLLVQGSPYSYPRTADQQVMKSIKALARPYEALAETFERRDWKRLQAELNAGSQIWSDDGNLRLVNDISSAILKYRVVDLQKTFAALPVKHVADHLGLAAEQTLNSLMDMIQSRQLDATLLPHEDKSPENAVLRFDTSNSSSQRRDENLEAQTRRIEDLIRYVRDADRRLQLSKEFVDVTKRAKRSGAEGDLADQMDLEYSSTAGINSLEYDGDEDIMA